MDKRIKSASYYADKIQNCTEEKFKKFKAEQIENTPEKVFENARQIYFYKELYVFLTYGDLRDDFEIDKLKILSDYGDELLDLLYEKYNKLENLSVSSGTGILDLFNSFFETIEDKGEKKND